MRFSGEMALAIAALWAVSACSVETATSGLGVTSSGSAGSTGTTSTGSAGSSMGGASSTTTSSGSSGAGGLAPDGAGGSVDVDGSTQDADASLDVGDAAPEVSEGGTNVCFAEDADAGDAGREPCASLPYYTQTCADDAGGRAPLGASICDALDGHLQVAAARELFDCLTALPGADACAPAFESAAADCSKNIFNRSMCAVPNLSVDGGAYGCAEIVASCPSDDGTAGITLAQCQAWLTPFNASARQGIIDCYLDPAMPAGSSCADKFENQCVFPP